MTESYWEIRQLALEKLETGNPQDAFREFRWVLEYPGRIENLAQWADAFEVFARIAEPIAGTDFASLMRAIALDPNNIQVLYDGGYELIEQSLDGIAATVLDRANALSPGVEAVLTELVCALEGAGQHEAACQVLRATPDLLDRSFLCKYLLAFNSLMSADQGEASRLLDELRQAASDEDYQRMVADLDGMLQRCQSVRSVTSLDARDLRGWHYAINGSVLLHLSPFGFEEGMNGRYAYTQDSPERCKEGIVRVGAVLDAWQMKPSQILVLPERGSEILGRAAAAALKLPLAGWGADVVSQPGLIVAYDLDLLAADLIEDLKVHRPGQILWSHALSWTMPQPFAPDLVTYLYQFNVAPWDARLSMDEESGEVVEKPPEEGSVEELAERIVTTDLDQSASEDLPRLLELAAAAAQMSGQHAPGAFRASGWRGRMWLESPVPSNRFL